jgi:hypothetical protein
LLGQNDGIVPAIYIGQERGKRMKTIMALLAYSLALLASGEALADNDSGIDHRRL